VPAVKETLAVASSALEAIAIGDGVASFLEDLERDSQLIDEPVTRRQAAGLIAWIGAAGRESRGEGPAPAQRSRRLDALRAELTLRSATFRHAARLSVALVAAGILYRALSLGSGYWVPLTVLFVLKPDYGTTITRAIGRAVGTIAGVTIAWAIVTTSSPSDAAIVALLALLAFAAYTIFAANYALFSVVLVGLIALLVEFSGGSPVGALVDRIIDTALGTAIALAAIILWPTREAPRTLERLAEYVAAEGNWLGVILNGFAGDDLQSLRSTRLTARRARVEAWDALRRAMAEPPRRRPDERPLRSVLSAMDEISERALTLAAAVHGGARAPHERLAPYRLALNHAFHATVACFRGSAMAPLSAPDSGVPAVVEQDPTLRTVAAETTAVLAELERLAQTWQKCARCPSPPRVRRPIGSSMDSA
jgi:uncharacterized membrane protein YccC